MAAWWLKEDPYVRGKLKWYNTSSERRAHNDWQESAVLDAIGSQLSGDALNYWNSLPKREKTSLIDSYYTDVDNGGFLDFMGGAEQRLDTETLLKHINEISAIETAPLLSKYVNVDSILADSQKAIDAENERLLASLNEDLASISEAYNNARNEMLAGQHQRNQMTVDTMASDMSRARRNAIEAGASAGIRIAGNVNSILSAQNKMSQQSLETSNQLAQMLVNQRNAEAGLRGQWRDIESSTYDRVQNRAQNEMNIGQQRYDQAHDEWQRKHDATVSESNALSDSMLKHKTKNAYATSGKSAF
ncbi:MAG: hypothetical protein J6R62_00305 [Rikenellaceae bacterium]|nr:hypothetical protein [Rikenellaceae bacterium]